MGGDERVVAGVEPYLVRPTPHPQLPPDEAKRGRVESLLEDDVAVAVQPDLLPDRQVVGCGWQRREPGLLDLREAVQRGLFGRAMGAQAGGRSAPHQHVGIGLWQRGGWATAEEVAFDVVDAALLDLAFVLRGARSAGGDEEPVVLGALAVRRLHL